MYNALILVDGNLTVKGEMAYEYYVTGDAQFDFLSMHSNQICLGNERVNYVQYQMAEDHEVVNYGRPRTVTAAYFFSYFYDLQAYVFSPETCIFALYHRDELRKYQTDNPLFVWHDYVFSLKPEFYNAPDAFWHDSLGVKMDNIYRAASAGSSIFIEGFDPACMSLFNRGQRLAHSGDQQQAILCYKKVTDMSPSFYPAYQLAGLGLFNLGAYQQAKDFFDKGVATMPESNADSGFYCATYSGLVSTIFGDYDAALSMANIVLERHPDAPMAKRVRGEALLYLNRLDEVERDLLAALEESPRSDRILWLLGLFSYQQNDQEKAANYFDQAKEINNSHVSYSEAESLHHLYGEDCPVGWLADECGGNTEPEYEQAHWDRFFDTHRDNDNWFEIQDLVTSIPRAFRSLEMFEYLISQVTASGAKKVTHGGLLSSFTHLNVDRAMMIKALNSDNSCSLSIIPSEVVDKSLILSCTKLPLRDVPESLQDYDVCLHCVSLDGDSFYSVPEDFRDERMLVQAIAGGLLSNYKPEKLPQKYQSSALILKAIDSSIEALDCISGQYIDQKAFKFAKTKYRTHEAWPALRRKHHRHHCEIGYDSLDQVWACYWNDRFVIKVADFSHQCADLI